MQCNLISYGRAPAACSKLRFIMANSAFSLKFPNAPAIVFCLGLAVSVLSVHSQPATNPSESRKPSIIFILADDLGYGDLGCYGQKRIKTPNIDKLAAEGMRFTSCYAGSTVSAPSPCALMTGLHTGHFRVRSTSQNQALATEDMTVAEIC